MTERPFEALGIAVRTVLRHIAAMQRAAGADNRVQLVWHAARHGWLDGSPQAGDTSDRPVAARGKDKGDLPAKQRASGPLRCVLGRSLRAGVIDSRPA